MQVQRLLLTSVIAAGGCGLLPRPALGAAALELYGTFEAMGVIVDLGSSDDPDGDATTQVEYRVAGAGGYLPGFPLSRVSDTRFVGSLFRLTPGTTYEARVTFVDPDGGPLDGTSVTGSSATRAEITIPAASHSYYVTPSGSGTTCSLASPCSLATAISQAQPGQAVVLRGGVYYQGQLTLPRSGTAGAPIVFRGYPGETAVIDGADPATFTWVAQGGGVYRATVNGADTHLVAANGRRLYPYQTLADLQSLSWGIPGFYASGTSVYVRLAADANPSSAAMRVSRLNHAFLVGQSHVYFVGLTFRHFGGGDYAKAIYINGGSENLVQGCTLTLNDLGIGLKNAAGRNVIEGNTFSDTDFDWPWDAVKAGSNLETGGVGFYSPVTGRGNVVRNNTFHDYFDGFGACPEETAGETNETDVYGNLVYNAGDDGLSSDGTCSNVRIWGNTFHDVLVGISLAPVYAGPVYAIRNVIYRIGAGNNDYPGLAFKFNSGYDASGPMFLFHNTVDAADAVPPGSNGLHIGEPGSWARITARNNIWSGTNYALYNTNPGQPLDLDYDDLHAAQAGELAWWDGLPDRHLNTLAELRAATGQELHGLDLAPDFVDPAAGDYTLPATSLLIDKGVPLAGINAGYQGAAPDLGAHEASAVCTYALTPTATAVGAQGAAGGVTVTAGAGCPWTAASNASWIVVTSGESGIGGGTVRYTVDANPAAARSGTITIADQTFTVAQAAAACHYSIAPATAAFDLPGGAGTVDVTAEAWCAWTATSHDLPWLAVTSGSPGTGDGSVGYAVAALGAGARAGMISIADQTFTVSQPPLTDRELAHGADAWQSLAAQGGVAHVDYYRLAQRPHSSYEVVVEGASGDVQPVVLDRLAPDLGTVLPPASQAIGAGAARSLRWRTSSASTVTTQPIRVRSGGGCTGDCGADDTYRIRCYETTAAIPRFNNAGSQRTVLILQNPTDHMISGTAHFWSGAGALLASSDFALAERQGLALNTSLLATLVGESGTITIAHDGRYGELTGKSVALESATGFSFDSPMLWRPAR